MSYKISTKLQFENFVTDHWNEINKYIDSQSDADTIPIYSSVDIRESKEKFAPIDLNIYPAGFNNLCALDLDYATELFEKALKKIAPDANNIAILPESHTKNLFYLDHLAILGKTIRDAGFNVSFLSFDEQLFSGESHIDLISHSNFDLTIHLGKVTDGEIIADQKKVDLVILNNDQSDPMGIAWDKIRTPIVPTPHIGWFERQKNTHFEFYKTVANDFCSHFNIFPELIQAKFKTVEGVNFSSKEGIEKLAQTVDELKKEIPEDKKIFVKASQGTYGMGISVVSSGEEILNMNRKKRNKMDVGKNKIKFTSLLVQEGVDTILKYDDMSAEVTIYLIDGKSAGGFMRANTSKGAHDNLNSKGMVFRKFCISEIKEHQEHKAKEAVYTVIARLSTLASSYEIKNVIKK